MTNEIDKKETQQLEVVKNQNMLDVVQKMATDPNVDIEKMQGLINIQTQLMDKQALINFNIDLNLLQGELPRITKNSSIKHGNQLISKYAKYDEIDRFIRPILIKYGFSLSYNSKPLEGSILMSGTLSHRDGHSTTSELLLPKDTSGKKQGVHPIGSTVTYGQRYLTTMLLNLVFEDDDDDGRMAGFTQISQEDAKEIKGLMQETGTDVLKFLTHFNAKDVDSMDAKRSGEAIRILNKKKKDLNDAD